MLFITNRTLNEGPVSAPGRKVSFNLDINHAEQSLYFCRRDAEGAYTEIGSQAFLAELKHTAARQILVYIHGYSNLPEPDIFPRTAAMQQLCDGLGHGEVLVVPVLWPCDNDPGIVKDYWDDQKAADASAFAYARLMEKFMAWRAMPSQSAAPCLKRINVLAHSMGNRVFRQTLRTWAEYDRHRDLPLLFRNTFLVAADIVNESLEYGQQGKYICDCSRNVSVYFASDDLALRASKVANVAQEASRRLGHTGARKPRQGSQERLRRGLRRREHPLRRPEGPLLFPSRRRRPHAGSRLQAHLQLHRRGPGGGGPGWRPDRGSAPHTGLSETTRP